MVEIGLPELSRLAVAVTGLSGNGQDDLVQMRLQAK
jgi:hypothetical protein